MFFCAISGTAPLTPVISSKSGHLYERSLIEKYIDENGSDPITGESLSKEDLVPVKASPSVAAPRPSAATSIPSLLHTFQAEWDAVVLESLRLKQEIQSIRQEHAHALYREDASLRVIARLVRERDQAREALGSVQATLGIVPSTAGGDVEMGSSEAAQGPNELPAEVKAKVTETHQALMSTRKKRKAPPGYATPETVSTYVETLSIPSMHASKPAGVSALDVSADGNLILTGGNDKVVQIYDRTTSKAVATLKGHTKRVNHVAFREQEGSKSVAVSAGADGKVQIFGEDEGKWSSAHKIAASKQEITGLALHPTKSYVASSSADSTCALYDLENGSIVQTYEPLSSGEGSYAYSSVAIHPDGLLLGGGTADGTVRIFDIRDKSTLAANLSNESGSVIPSLSFSENGYHLAVANSANSSIGIFDLRKLSLLHSISLPTASAPGGGKISSLRFDASGQFLACAGTDLRVFKNKTWEECLAFEGNTAELSDVRFGPLGKEIVLSGADRTVRVLSAPMKAE